MDFSLNESQTAVAQLARKIFHARVTQASLQAVEAQPEHIDRALWSELASVGLLGTALPAHVLTPSVTARGIVNMTAIAATEAAAGPCLPAP